jgi:hypothetical protein
MILSLLIIISLENRAEKQFIFQGIFYMINLKIRNIRRIRNARSCNKSQRIYYEKSRNWNLNHPKYVINSDFINTLMR